MSVLSFPRIYFNGFMAWDVNTANNNDYVPAYATAGAELNWQYLSSQGITPENFRDRYRPWAVLSTPDSCPSTPPDSSPDSCAPNQHMGSRWNYYGGNGCWFVQYEQGGKLSRTVNGHLAYNKPASSSDPILGKPVQILGNVFGDRVSAARLVDVNPGSPWSSQIYCSSFYVGDDPNSSGSKTFIGGAPSCRMFSRSFFVPRNISSELMIAGAIGVVFQMAIPASAVKSSNDASSPLLASLLSALGQPGVQGVMIRFAAYSTLYYKNGIFNDISQQPRTCSALSQLYAAGQVFINPAYTSIAGTVGAWGQGELASAPGGHFLVPNQQVPPLSTASSAASSAASNLRVHRGELVSVVGHSDVKFAATDAAAQGGLPSLAWGNIWAEVNSTAGIVSLDMSNAIPEYTADGLKIPYGPIDVGVRMTDGSFNRIGTIQSNQYDKPAYDSTSGIVDVPFDSGVTAATVTQWLAAGLLALRVQNTVIAALEQPLTAETDSRGVYIDECKNQQLTVQVRYKNGLPPAGTRLKLAQYSPFPLTVASGSWAIIGAPPTQPGVCGETAPNPYLNLIDGDTIPVDANGQATVRIASNEQGFPIISFFPYLPGSAAPVPPSTVAFGFTQYGAPTIGTAGYFNARVLPFNNSLVAEFVDRWNGTGKYAGQPKYDPVLTWQFMYAKIFYVYDMLYPVMDDFMPLGNRLRVEGAAEQLIRMVSVAYENTSTLYMPVTRELSAGKRLIIETWCNLVIRKYPPQDLPPLQVSCDS